MKSLIISIVLLGCATLLSAEPILEATDTKKISDEGMKLVAEGKIDEALKLLSEVWPLSAEEIDSFKTETETKLSSSSFMERFGEILEAEYAGSMVVGESLVKHNYILKMENHILCWYFVFYKPKDEWRMHDLNWNDKIEDLFDEVGKTSAFK